MENRVLGLSIVIRLPASLDCSRNEVLVFGPRNRVFDIVYYTVAQAQRRGSASFSHAWAQLPGRIDRIQNLL